MLGNEAIALGDSLALLPWRLRVNLGPEGHYYTSVLEHPRQREVLRVLEICCKGYIISSVTCRGDTWGPKYYLKYLKRGAP